MAVMPLYFVRYIHVSTALIFRTLYSWLYEVLVLRLRKYDVLELPLDYRIEVSRDFLVCPLIQSQHHVKFWGPWTL